MAANVGVNVTCNSNCTNWCPRSLKVKICCCVQSQTDSDEEEDNRKTVVDRKVKQTSNAIFIDKP